MGTPHCSRLLAGLVAPWREEPRLGRLAGRTYGLTEDPHWNSLFMEDWIVWKGPLLEQGISVRNSSPEEEGVTETACDELTTALITCPPELLEGRGRE